MTKNRKVKLLHRDIKLPENFNYFLPLKSTFGARKIVRTAGRMLALHVTDLCSIPGTPSDLSSMPRVMPEYTVRNKP